MSSTRTLHGGCLCRDPSKAKALARRILCVNTKTAAAAKPSSGRCPKCGVAEQREGVIVDNPLRRNVPYMEKDVSENIDAEFRLALAWYVSVRGYKGYDLGPEDGDGGSLADRVYAQLVLGDSTVLEDWSRGYDGDFRKLPVGPRLLETLNGIIECQAEQVLRDKGFF